MLGPFALVVLDMAGTTVRDDGAVDEAFTAALSSVGIRADDPRFASAQATCTRPWASPRRTCSPLCSNPTRRRATEEFARAYEHIVAEGRVAPMEGATDVFAALRGDGVQVCLTTGFAPSTRDALLAALGWEALVDLALSPADCGRGRPAPDMIFGAMERLGVTDPGAVAVVGDTTSDLEAGTNAGARAVIGVLSGAHDRTTLSAAPHTDLIDDVTGLIAVLTRS